MFAIDPAKLPTEGIGSLPSLGAHMTTDIVEHPAGSRQRFIVAAACMALLVAGLALIPVSSVSLLALPHASGIYAACVALTDLLTFILLRPGRDGPRSLHILAGAYLYSSIMALLNLLHFPGAVIPNVSLMGESSHVGWLYLAWRIGFPILVLWAIVVQWHQSRGRVFQQRGHTILAMMIGLAAAITAIVHFAPLPRYYPSGDHAFAQWTTIVSYLGAGVSAAAVLVIWRAGLFRSSLYTWLALVLFANAVGLALSTTGGGRYTLAWYATRAGGLLTSCVVLALLTRHFIRLQSSLASTVATLRERTQALQTEIQRREHAERMLLQSQKLEAVGQLAAGLAHDFNNLMQVVSSRMELIRRKTSSATIDSDIEVVRRTLHRAEGLTRQLLIFSGRRSLQPQPIDLYEWSPPLVEMLRSLVRSDVRIELVVAPGVGTIEVDVSELESALVNLVSNARDALPRGGHIRIRMAHEPAADGSDTDLVCIEVSDDGDGIPSEVLQRAFEPFFTTKAIGKGSGLGLSQVYAFATRSGGTIAIESTLGIGTTVRLRFPRAANPAPLAYAAQSFTPIKPLTNGLVVLLVDDDEDVRSSTAGLLEQLGYVVRLAHTAEAALELINRGLRPYAVLSDIVMPGGFDGIELGCKARALYPDLVIVLCTGYSTAANRATQEGFIVLHKPYQSEQLDRALRQGNHLLQNAVG